MIPSKQGDMDSNVTTGESILITGQGEPQNRGRFRCNAMFVGSGVGREIMGEGSSGRGNETRMREALHKGQGKERKNREQTGTTETQQRDWTRV
ncbi:hypothetical protein DTO271G3_4017 [Paecilomyces variotii]|nr:hypothetical protein DTO271G3_4017 [Paecilomyces variotii]